MWGSEYVNTSIRVIGAVTLADGSCRSVYELEDGTQYVVDDDGSLLTGNWLLVAEDEQPEPCDKPVIVYPDGAPAFRPCLLAWACWLRDVAADRYEYLSLFVAATDGEADDAKQNEPTHGRTSLNGKTPILR